MTLGEKLVAAREARGWNQNTAARIAGVGRTTLRQLEEDVQLPENIRLHTAAALIDAYDGEVSMMDFLGDFPFKNIRSIGVKR